MNSSVDALPRRPNRLRKPRRLSEPRPRPHPPLSFIPEPNSLLAIHPQSPPEDVSAACNIPDLHLILPIRGSNKLTKRQRRPLSPSDQVPPSSSSAAALAAAALPAQPMSHPDTKSESAHGPPTKRGSLIRHFSVRSPHSSTTELTSPKWTRWKSFSSKPRVSNPNPPFLPLVRITSPFDVQLSPTVAPRPKFSLSNDSDIDLPRSVNASQSSIAHPSPRPRLVRRDAVVGNSAYGTQKRRWTLAMAMTDEAITDEVLVEKLDKMVLRMKQEWSGSVDDVGSLWDVDIGRQMWETTLNGYSDSGESAVASPDVQSEPAPSSSKLPYTPSLPSFPLQHRLSAPAPASTASWQTARRALLTCRELVRTERHYLASIRALLSKDTATPPPSLMLHYVGELVNVSESLMTRLEENPSAWGVAAAFLAKEESIDAAFVGWCGVVGSWFIGEEKPTRGRGSASASASRRSSPTRRGDVEHESSSPSVSPLLRTVSTWRRSMTSIPILEKEKHSPAIKRKPTVRELAILPTQRVMRYALLYRDLLAHTPSTSPSRALVERAVEAARRIAQKCDRAQENADFLSGTTMRRKVASSSAIPSLPRSRTDQSKNSEL